MLHRGFHLRALHAVGNRAGRLRVSPGAAAAAAAAAAGQLLRENGVPRALLGELRVLRPEQALQPRGVRLRALASFGLPRPSRVAGCDRFRSRVERDDAFLDDLLERVDEGRHGVVVQSPRRVLLPAPVALANLAVHQLLRGYARQGLGEDGRRRRRDKLRRLAHLVPPSEKLVQADARGDDVQHRVRVDVTVQSLGAKAAPEQHRRQSRDVRRAARVPGEIREHREVRGGRQEGVHRRRTAVKPRDEQAEQHRLELLGVFTRRGGGGDALGVGEARSAPHPAAAACSFAQRRRGRRAHRRGEEAHDSREQQVGGLGRGFRHLERDGQDPRLCRRVTVQGVAKHGGGVARNLELVRGADRSWVIALAVRGFTRQRAREQTAERDVALAVVVLFAGGRDRGDEHDLKLGVTPQAPSEDALSRRALSGVQTPERHAQTRE